MKDGKPWRERRAEAEAQQKKLQQELIRPKPSQAPVPLPPGPSPNRPWPTVPPNHNPHEFRGIDPWTPGRIWHNEIVCIIGGGPALKTEEGRAALERTKQGCRTIAINNAYRRDKDTSFVGAPWADMLFFTDCQWWRWNFQHVRTHWPKNRFLVTSTSDTAHATDEEAGRKMQRMWRDRNDWSKDIRCVFGYDGGTQCVNLAAHLGAKRIVLLGIDLQGGPKGEAQYHKLHLRPTVQVNYKTKFIPTMIEAVKRCKEQGIEIVRGTPGFDVGAPLVSMDVALKPGPLELG